MRILFFCFTALIAAWTAPAFAQDFPRRPVRFVVPLPPGGSPDVMARTIASGLSASWAHQIVVDNRPGAHHNLAAGIVAKSAPDGHTWLLTTDNILVVNPHVEKVPFDPFRDFTPVTQIAQHQGGGNQGRLGDLPPSLMHSSHQPSCALLGAVEAAVLDRFRNVRRRDGTRPREIGNRAGDLEHAVVTPRR
jgi:hypothetical protein